MVDAPIAPVTATKTILVIEDDRETRAVITAMLSFGNFTVQVAEDRARGLAIMRKFRPDLILIDICMPGMSLDDFIDTVRLDETQPKLALMSAYPLLHSECERLGVKNILTKPFQSATLLRSIKSWLTL